MDTVAAFRTPAVRDLAWALASPALLSPCDNTVCWPKPAWFATVAGELREHLAQLDRNPQPLLECIAAQGDRRLGVYFETLLGYWLSNNPRYRLLSANLPVRSGGRTLGEFDFIVRDAQTGRTLHWEVALKFYLGDGDTRETSHWWGPGRRDRLDIKTTHMLERQTRLAERPEAQAVLRDKGLAIDERWLIFKGRLFYPGIDPCTARPPEAAAEGHLRGFWLTESRLPALPEAQWQVLTPRQWLAPLADTGRGLDRASLIRWWHESERRPVCIAQLGARGESARGFVVPDTWPDR